MNVLLLEDEYPAAERLQRLLRQAAPEAHVLAVLDSVSSAVQWLGPNPAPDLILSDIQLADGLSLDVFDQLVVRSPVIFTTAYDAYAIRAFKANSVDYLLKPVKLAELQAALTKLREWRMAPPETTAAPTPPAAAAEDDTARRLERLLDALPRPDRQYKTRFLVRSGEQLLPLAVSQVAWFQSRHETTTLATTDNRRFVVDYTLEQLETLLDPTLFFRMNRQFIAQLPAVQRLHPHFNGKLLLELQPAPSEEVLVSREKAGAVKSWLEG
ncbi:DNA-binding LytR/AlgR family response regulator [Hymenobacter luteus]|uniref:DNA-binding LytR/AlgR family response regulator n=2 Tax=Hymenobacter TaxID=89966 RepID=A0A7W9WCE8_9BACT|nr:MULTISPECIES: LytTR family DNA-binding domain-containing protein [Hymenobacter]MBB4602912.1 DNA-binding LytR/AlgR family response regulator [Hymenobacter latericoloratus]MBB6060804.1 DNA-binding LytR/AlgR family response regulator [Hymenobacter luteus]